MIISRTPFRISYFGGGTDYPAWYRREGGAVLSTTIDKYCYITCRYFPPFFGHKHRIVWSRVETPDTMEEVQHPVIRAGVRYLGFNDDHGLDIHHQGDLPARSGIGSSSAFTVGLIKALTALRGEMIGKHVLALKGIELEQSILREAVGSQDQVAAAYGGFNYIEFLPSGEIRVEPLTVPSERLGQLESCLMLFFTGLSRYASDIAATVIANLDKRQDVLRRMRAQVDQGLEILKSDRPLDEFGALLHDAWMHKQQLSDAVSNEGIDGIYETARAHGALGGKLLGAGESGFMVFYVPSDQQPAVRRALSHLVHVPFRFSRGGSAIIHYEPNHTILHGTEPEEHKA